MWVLRALFFFQYDVLARVRVLFLAFRALSRVIICTIGGNLLDREKEMRTAKNEL